MQQIDVWAAFKKIAATLAARLNIYVYLTIFWFNIRY